MSDYMKAAHAMQAGVAIMMQYNPRETEPKHLRVGINSVMSDMGGLVSLLLEKGLFTREEYEASITEFMKREAASYKEKLEAIIKEQTGNDVNITLV